MTEAQFELAMMDLTMSAANREAARLFLVEGKTAADLSKEQDISASRLSKILKRVVCNFEKQLDSLQLVSCEYMLDEGTAKLVRELEAVKVSEAKLKAGAIKKRRREKQKSV